MSEYENAVEITNLSKKFDGFSMENISFAVPRGSIMGFIGQNGAGKTTTIKAMLNIIAPDSGSIKLLGMDSVQQEISIKERIAAVFDELPFHGELTARDISLILGDIYGEWDNGAFRQCLDRFCLPEKKRIGQFSKGMKMKLQIACALSHNAELLIMDEPTTGLDPVVRNEILDIFQEYIREESHTIFLSSHITGDLERIADSVTFIDKGRLLLTGIKDDIIESHGVIKCTLNDYKKISPEDIISARLTDFGAQVMIADRPLFQSRYSGLIMDSTTLEEIMLFYINRGKKEWR